VVKTEGRKGRISVVSDIHSTALCGNSPGAIARNRAAKAVGLNNSQILTAVPVGTLWCVKAITKSGDKALIGAFEGRLTALGAAVLLAEQFGARVVP
jgi:hypothetical protein